MAVMGYYHSLFLESAPIPNFLFALKNQRHHFFYIKQRCRRIGESTKFREALCSGLQIFCPDGAFSLSS